MLFRSPIDTLLKISLCSDAIKDLDSNDRICPVREDSLNRYLNRGLKEMNITRYSNSKTGIHSIRKKVAKEKMTEAKTEGYTNQQSRDKTSKYLGHNKNRDAVINAYIHTK